MFDKAAARISAYFKLTHNFSFLATETTRFYCISNSVYFSEYFISEYLLYIERENNLIFINKLVHYNFDWESLGY